MMSADGLVPIDAVEVAAAVVGPSVSNQNEEAAPTFESREELRQWLIQLADRQWGAIFGQPTYNWGWHGWLDYDGAVLFRTMSDRVSFLATNGSSSTNVQVEGVDEADLVETDGEYIYLISGRDLTIVKAGVGDDLKVVSRATLDTEPTGMYLDGDRLAIISSKPHPYAVNPSFTLRPMITVDVASFSDSAWSDEQQDEWRPTTTVTILDITDRSQPELVRKTEFDGSVLASRAVDGNLRLVIANGFSLPHPLSRPAESPAETPAVPSHAAELRLTAIADIAFWSPNHGQQYVYETRQEYLDRVIDALIDDLPKMRELSADGQVLSESALASPTDIHRPDDFDVRSLTTIATIDMHGSGRVADKATVMTTHNPIVYATADDVYLLAESYRTSDDANGWALTHEPVTKIWKFGMNAASDHVRLVAKGEVEGSVLNQFAIDEHAGHLRVVTSTWGEGQQLSVLKQVGKQLTLVGKVDDIAPGENLHSVRFMGDRAFAVTFRTVDPLFAIDLSDPTNPVVAGELKIPGYSDYLQPLDENHLIGIGRDADEQTGLFQEMRISIFSVADLSDPQLLHQYSFAGGRSTASVATGDRWMRGDGDHHAVGYFASEQILAIPIFSNEGWWGSSDDEPIFEPGEGGLQVFHIDVESGLTPTALIEHDSPISRAVRVGDYLYAISPGAVTVHSLDDPATQLGEVEIDSGGETVALRMWEPESFTTITMVTETPSEASPLDERPSVAVVKLPNPLGISTLSLNDRSDRDAAIELVIVEGQIPRVSAVNSRAPAAPIQAGDDRFLSDLTHETCEASDLDFCFDDFEVILAL